MAKNCRANSIKKKKIPRDKLLFTTDQQQQQKTHMFCKGSTKEHSS